MQAVTKDKDEEDEDDLLDFATGLNFEKYMDDVEIKTMMEIVKNRINELERESKQEDIRDMEVEERGIKGVRGYVDFDTREGSGIVSSNGIFIQIQPTTKSR